MGRAQAGGGLIHLRLRDFRIDQSHELIFLDLAIPVRGESLDIAGDLTAYQYIGDGIQIARRGHFCLNRAAFDRECFENNGVLQMRALHNAGYPQDQQDTRGQCPFPPLDFWDLAGSRESDYV